MITLHTDDRPLSEWAWSLARGSLEGTAPRRWRHIQGVVALAREIAPQLPVNQEVLIAAAALIGVGWAPQYAETGFASLDGARVITRLAGPPRVAALIAHYIASEIEAELRGLGEAIRGYPDERTLESDALWFCDLSVDPDGIRIDPAARLAEIRERYGEDAIVMAWLDRAGGDLLAAVERVRAALASEKRTS